MKVGFTGTQQMIPAVQAGGLLLALGPLSPSEFHHGDCIGADAAIHKQVRAYFPATRIFGHLPLNNSKRAFCDFDFIFEPKDYPERNRDIVWSTAILLAAPKGLEEIRSGTWSTIRFARKLQRPIVLVFPDGHTIRENVA